MNFGQLDSNVGELVFKTVSNALKKKQEKVCPFSVQIKKCVVSKESFSWQGVGAKT